MNILITGGASGLGAALTSKLAENKNWKILFTFSNSSDKAVKLEKEHSNVAGIKCDFKNENDIKNLIQKIQEFSPDALINNAWTGNFIKNHFHKTPAAELLLEFRENVMPVMEITQACIHEMRKKKNGRILTVLTSALIGNPPIGASVYTANKAYLQQMVKAWASENIKFNISSNSVSPSFMETAMTSQMDERLIEQMRDNHPLKRFLKPEEVAETIEGLLKASVHVTGTDIVINAAQNIR